MKVLDFGVAKFMGETIGARELTVGGTPVGSPSYMSPEQADGDKKIDHRSDLYSLGRLLYHAVTGQPPSTGTSQWAVLRKQMRGRPGAARVPCRGAPGPPERPHPETCSPSVRRTARRTPPPSTTP